jgi:Na+(H+)/acetate symporter ActP
MGRVLCAFAHNSLGGEPWQLSTVRARSTPRSRGWSGRSTFLGFGARVILGTGGEEAAGKGGNLAAPLLAQELGGGDGTLGGDAFLAIIAAVAFATILAVVAGLVISASGAVAHDVWSNVVRRGRDSGTRS